MSLRWVRCRPRAAQLPTWACAVSAPQNPAFGTRHPLGVAGDTGPAARALTTNTAARPPGPPGPPATLSLAVRSTRHAPSALTFTPYPRPFSLQSQSHGLKSRVPPARRPRIRHPASSPRAPVPARRPAPPREAAVTAQSARRPTRARPASRNPCACPADVSPVHPGFLLLGTPSSRRAPLPQAGAADTPRFRRRARPVLLSVAGASGPDPSASGALGTEMSAQQSTRTCLHSRH